MTTTDRTEILAWLGEAADEMTREQVDDLTRHAADIADHYGEDAFDEANSALITAHQIMTGVDPVRDLAQQLTRARAEQAEALAGLRQAAIMQVGMGDETQAGFARRAGVDRMAVREWLGQRNR